MRFKNVNFPNSKELWVTIGIFVISFLTLLSSYINLNILEVLVILSLLFIFIATLLFPEFGLAVIIIPTSFTRVREIAGLGVFSVKYLIFFALFFVIISRIIRSEKILRVPRFFTGSYLMLAIILLISLTYTSNLPYGVEKVVEFFTITGLAFLSPFFLLNTREKIERFFFFIVSMAVSLSASFVLFGLIFSLSKLIDIFGSNYVAVGHLTGMAILIIAYYVEKNVLKNILVFFAITILLTAMIISGGKGPVISLVATMLIVSVFSIKFVDSFKKLQVKSVVFLQMVILLILVFSLIVSPAGTVLINRVIHFVDVWDLGGETRVDALRLSVEMVKDHPILGEGMGSFETEWVKLGSHDSFSYPHNIFLEVWSEAGILALLLFVSILFLGIKTVTQRKVHNYSSRMVETVFALVLFFTMNSLLSGYLNNQALFLFIALSYSIKLNSLR